MSRIEPDDMRNDPRFAAPRFAPLDGETVSPVARSQIPRMPTLGAFAVARLAGKIKARLMLRQRKERIGDNRTD